MNNYVILRTFLFPEKFCSHTSISVLELPFQLFVGGGGGGGGALNHIMAEVDRDL